MTTAACCRAFVLSADRDDLAEDYAKWFEGRPNRFRDIWFFGFVRELGIFEVNPVKGTRYDRPTLLYRCTNLGDDGKCSIYESRPDVCHGYPSYNAHDGGVCKYPKVCESTWCEFWRKADEKNSD